MLLTLLTTALAQTPVEPPEFSQERLGGPLGLGVSVGVPTGLSGRLWIGDWSAVQFGAGGQLGVLNSVVGTADYCVILRPFEVPENDYAVPLHIGGGFKFDAQFPQGASTILMGPRAVFGASLLVPDLPIDFHAELAPSFLFYETLGWSIDGQIGVRYYL